MTIRICLMILYVVLHQCDTNSHRASFVVLFNMDNAAVDIRSEFIGSYVTKTLRLKPEKWLRVVAAEEYKAILLDFLDNDTPTILIITLTSSLQLIPVTRFPVSLKNKGVYFVKKSIAAVPKDVPEETLIIGDIATKAIDYLASLVDEIFVPLLCNVNNHEEWPAVVAQDVNKHVHSLKSTLYQVRRRY